MWTPANSGSPALTLSKCKGTPVALSLGAGWVLRVLSPFCLLTPDHDPRAEHAAAAGGESGVAGLMAKATPRHPSLLPSVHNSTY